MVIYHARRSDLRLTRAQVLLFSVTMPTYVLLLAAPITTAQVPDIIFTQVLIGCVFLAFNADQQQWGRQSIPNTSQMNQITDY